MKLELVHLGITLEVPEGIDAPRLDLLHALTFPLPFYAGAKVLDLGCGAGLYALAALKAGCHVLATDVCPEAIAATRANAVRNALATERLTSSLGDLFGAVPNGVTFDVIVANLPQTPCPDSLVMSDTFRESKCAGPDGLHYIRPLFDEFSRYLREGGCLFMLQIGWLDWRVIDASLHTRGYRCQELGRGQRRFTWQEYESYAPGLATYLQQSIEHGTAQPITSRVDGSGQPPCTFPARWVTYRRIGACPQ